MQIMHRPLKLLQWHSWFQPQNLGKPSRKPTPSCVNIKSAEKSQERGHENHENASEAAHEMKDTTRQRHRSRGHLPPSLFPYSFAKRPWGRASSGTLPSHGCQSLAADGYCQTGIPGAALPKSCGEKKRTVLHVYGD